MPIPAPARPASGLNPHWLVVAPTVEWSVVVTGAPLQSSVDAVIVISPSTEGVNIVVKRPLGVGHEISTSVRARERWNDRG